MNNPRSKKLNKIKNELRDGLKTQVKAYEEMFDLSRQQIELIKENNVSELSKLVRAKNKILERIEHAENQVLPILKHWQDLRSEFSEETVQEVEEKFEHARSLLSDIIDLESEMEEYAQDLLDQTSEQIEDLVKAEGAQETYSETQPDQADRFIDRNE